MKFIYSILRPIAERYPWFAKLYRDFRDGRSLTKPSALTPMGFKFSGQSAMEAGTFETQEVKWFYRLLRQSEIFINVGANIGYYSCIALHQNIPTLAIEPVELNLKYLYKNISDNGWQKDIEVVPLAVGNHTGLIKIYGGGTVASVVKGWSGVPGYYWQWVPVSTLDRIVGSRCEGKKCLILVDIEGAEHMMLEGAKKLLSMNPRPVWMMEICITEHMPEGVHINPHLLTTFRTFWEHGYGAWTCTSNSRRVEESEIQDILRTGNNTLKTHNFIFIPREYESV